VEAPRRHRPGDGRGADAHRWPRRAHCRRRGGRVGRPSRRAVHARPGGAGRRHVHEGKRWRRVAPRRRRVLPDRVRPGHRRRPARDEGGVLMETRTDEIADRIYRISTFIPEIAPPTGFTFNQFLIDAEEPLLYHTGQKQLFPLVSEAVAKVVPLERLRWIAFSHFEADECGAMNDFL